jgi:hypothetical protein
MDSKTAVLIAAQDGHESATGGFDLLVQGAARLLETNSPAIAWAELTRQLIKAGGFQAGKTITLVESLTAAAINVAGQDLK